MILLAGSPNIDSSPPTLTDASLLTPDLDRGQPNKASAPHGESCLRSGGLLVRSCALFLKYGHTDRSMTSGALSTAATTWRATSWPTDGRALGRHIRVMRDHRTGPQHIGRAARNGNRHDSVSGS